MLERIRESIALAICPNFARLRERNIDLMTEVQGYIKAGYCPPEQFRDIERIIREHRVLVKDQEELVVFLRENLPGFKEGRHTQGEQGRTFGYFVTSLMTSIAKGDVKLHVN
jgi:hypothetical protein